MPSHRNARLSKSRFTAGLQCLKRLYLECYNRDLADAVDAATQARFDTGNEVGELARHRFPGGTLVAESYMEHDQAVATTQTLLDGTSVVPLYEAAFTFEGIRILADVLQPNGGGSFDLIEVKSTTGYDSAKHLADVAIQLYVLEQSGIPVNRAWLMHLNNQYVYQGGDYDLQQLFTLAGVTEEARQFVADSVPDELAAMWEVLRWDEPPDIATGGHCNKPYHCPFYGYCHLEDLGPPDTDARKAEISPYLKDQLAELEYPVSFLDFETIGPALPIYVGTRPYQAVPFQWSLHVLESEGKLTHREFLNDDAADPRERVITSLLEAAPPGGSIVAYSSYEKTTLTRLAEAFPHYAAHLTSLIDRLYDLLPVTRRGYQHPGLSSYSLKSTLPFLVPGWDYADLEIQEGTLASIAYLKMVMAATPADEKAKIRENLLAYCARDTEATVKVLEALRAAAEG